MISIVCSVCNQLVSLLADETMRDEIPRPFVCKDCKQEDRNGHQEENTQTETSRIEG